MVRPPIPVPIADLPVMVAVKLGDKLFYDSMTRIVTFIHGSCIGCEVLTCSHTRHLFTLESCVQAGCY